MTPNVRALALLALCAVAPCPAQADDDSIRPFAENPRYWSFRGAPVLLLGGSVEDNLFQIDGLEAHLDLLKASGGNYVRNTMSSRDPGNLWPFRKVGDRYDLDQWDDAYWQRFKDFLKLTSDRGIVVQIEVWDRFDFAMDYWQSNPFNPRNNTNYDAETSRLKPVIDSHPGQRENAFFRALPELEDNPVVYRYQKSIVDKMLSIALPFDNVLYCIDNETNESPLWGAHWAALIQQRAAEAGVTVHITEMWDPWDLSDPMHDHTLNHPERYSFVDISQNNHKTGQAHADNALAIWNRLADRPRPLNNVKTYGADTGRYGSDRDGEERFWRSLFVGCASARFHRPDSGLGLSAKAQAHIKSARELTNALTITRCVPRNDLLSNREPNEAYLLAEPGRQYALYFPNGGAVTLDLGDTPQPLEARWLNILESQWDAPRPLENGPSTRLEAPGRGHWAVLIQPTIP